MLLWGTSFVAAKFALRSIPPLGLAAFRGVLGLLIFLPALAAFPSKGTDRPLPGDGRRILVLALLGVVVQTGLQAFALTWTSAVHAGWLIALIPIFAAVLSAAFLGERFPRAKTAGVLLGFGGAVVVVYGGASSGSFSSPATAGDALILLSAFNWAVYTLLARSLLRRRAVLPVTARILGWGTAVLLVLASAAGGVPDLGAVRVESWVALAYLGLLCTGVGYLSWSKALERFEPGALTTFQYLQPLVSALTAWALLDEPLHGSTLLGGAFVLGGVALVQRAASPP